LNSEANEGAVWVARKVSKSWQHCVPAGAASRQGFGNLADLQRDLGRMNCGCQLPTIKERERAEARACMVAAGGSRTEVACSDGGEMRFGTETVSKARVISDPTQSICTA